MDQRTVKVTMDEAVDRLHALMTEQVTKLMQDGWPGFAILRATEQSYASLMVTAAAGLKEGERALFTTGRLATLNATIHRETQLMVLRQSVPATKTPQ